MPRTKNSVNKSAEIRQLLKADRTMSAKEVVDALDKRGIKVTDSLVYFIRGQIKGKRSQRRKMMAKMATTTAASAPASNGDTVATISTILKVKGWAAEVGGLAKLKELVDALN